MPTDRMLARKESAVYAQALLEAARSSGTVFEVTGQLEQANKAIFRNIELRTTLYDRSIPDEVRIAIIKEIFVDFDAALLAVFGVMVKRDNLRLLGKVAEAFALLAEEALDAVFIDVTTIVSLDDTLRDLIKKKYSAQFGRDVLLREHIDPAIMGGIVLSTHGISIDASIVSQLENARAVLSQAS